MAHPFRFRREAAARNDPEVFGLRGPLAVGGLRRQPFLFSGSAWGKEPIAFPYFYDDLNQLAKVVDSTGVLIE